MPLIRKTYLIEDVMLEDINKLRSHLRLTTEVNVIRTAINLLWKDTFKYGTDPRLNFNNISSSIEEVAERKVKLKVAQEKVTQELKDKPKVDRCLNILKGEIITNPDGSKICKWQTHDTAKSYDQSIPLSQCGEYLVDNLFMPDRESVLKARPELKEIFK